MSTTLGDAPLSSSVEPTAPAGGATWRAALRWAAIGQLAMAGYMVAITAAFEGRFDPMPVVIGAIVGVGVWRLGRPGSGRGAVVYAGIVSLLLLLMVLAFGGLAVLLRPESTLELILFGGLLVFSVLGLVAAPGAFTGRAPSRASAIAPRAALAVLAALAVVGVVAGALTGSATRMVGDVEAGSYRFYCSLHPDMEGTLRVS